jgi:hypothetical protein
MWRSVALAVRSKCRSVIHSACRFLSRLTFTVVDVACERLSFHLRATARARNPACLVNDEQQLARYRDAAGPRLPTIPVNLGNKQLEVCVESPMLSMHRL